MTVSVSFKNSNFEKNLSISGKLVAYENSGLIFRICPDETDDRNGYDLLVKTTGLSFRKITNGTVSTIWTK